ncbi:MAG: helix-turn-helix transcriptional regulator [Oscillospiraceae bacterium]|nr:helix-turn-helix transcriptional regulator [Oscillospiraceae bacterium]
MDLLKIGRFIAERRKTLGLTQKQVAEKLGMSDKSVSKWERGVCLPDVSVYQELCDILGISINEFLAGEPISREELEKRSEDNLIQVTAEGKRRQKKLKGIAAILLAVAVLALAVTGWVLFRDKGPGNYVAALDRESPEQRTAELLSGVDGAFLYRYETKAPYRRLTLTAYLYRKGEPADHQELAIENDGPHPSARGMIVLLPDFSRFSVKVILADETGKLSTELPILEEAEGREYYGRASVRMEGTQSIRFGEEMGLLALIYDPKEMRVTDIRSLEQGDFSGENEYLYFFTARFDK